MKTLACQLKKLTLEPCSVEDAGVLAEYKDNQILEVTVKGSKKARSIKELGLFMACCQIVAENTDNPRWDTKEKAVFSVKVALHFVDTGLVAVTNDGSVVFQYLSLSFKNLHQAKAHHFFERGFDILAQRLGVSVEDLIVEAKERMRKRIF